MGLDESNRLSNEDLEALQSLQNGFQKCVVSTFALEIFVVSFTICFGNHVLDPLSVKSYL